MVGIERVEVEGRRWYRGPDKQLMPSASSVLDILFPMNKDFIPEEALAMGTLCHNETSKALVCAVNNTPYPVHSDGRVVKRVAAALTWLAKVDLEILAVESPTCFLRVGMTPDMLGGMRNGSLHVVDWKFAESMTERYYFQAEIYMRAEEAESATVVRIDRLGEVYPVTITRNNERWELVKSAINVRHHLDRRAKKYI